MWTGSGAVGLQAREVGGAGVALFDAWERGAAGGREENLAGLAEGEWATAIGAERGKHDRAFEATLFLHFRFSIFAF